MCHLMCARVRMCVFCGRGCVGGWWQSVAKVIWLLSYCLCPSIWGSLFLAASLLPHFVMTLSRVFLSANILHYFSSLPLVLPSRYLSFLPFLPDLPCNSLPVIHSAATLTCRPSCTTNKLHMQWFAADGHRRATPQSVSHNLDNMLFCIMQSCVIMLHNAGEKKVLYFPAAWRRKSHTSFKI